MIARIVYYNAYCDCVCYPTEGRRGLHDGDGKCWRSLGEDGVDVMEMLTGLDAAAAALALGWQRKGRRFICSACVKHCEPREVSE